MKLKNTFLALAGLSLIASVSYAQSITTASTPVTIVAADGTSSTASQGAAIALGSEVRAGAGGAVVSTPEGRVLLGSNASAKFTSEGVEVTGGKVSFSANSGATITVIANQSTSGVAGTVSFTMNADGTISMQVVSGSVTVKTPEGEKTYTSGQSFIIAASPSTDTDDKKNDDNPNATEPEPIIITSKNKGTNVDLHDNFVEENPSATGS